MSKPLRNAPADWLLLFPFFPFIAWVRHIQQGLRAIPPCSSSKMFLFLGSSIGNMERSEIDLLLSQLFDNSAPGRSFLARRRSGQGSGHHRPGLQRFGGVWPALDPQHARSSQSPLRRQFRHADNFRYRSEYDSLAKRNEVRIQSLVHQTVTLASLTFTVSFGAQEIIDAEVMLEIRSGRTCRAILERAGFSMMRRWIEPDLPVWHVPVAPQLTASLTPRGALPERSRGEASTESMIG